MLKCLLVALAVLAMVPVVLVGSIVGEALVNRSRYARAQIRHMEQLERHYASPGFTPVREQDFTAFDLERALERGVKLNEMQFLATHNSYKLPISPVANFFSNNVLLRMGLTYRDEFLYGFETLTQQLDRGIRSIELDVMRQRGSFRCGHMAIVDMNSSIPDLALGLREIKMWSDANPGHLPITILIENKTNMPIGGPYMSVDDLLDLDKLLLQAFGETLLTPGELLGGFESFAALREGDAWPPLREVMGRVLALYHFNGATTWDYIALDPSLRSQAMFPVLSNSAVRYEEVDAASFILCNHPVDLAEVIPALVERNMIIRTRLDMYLRHPPERFHAGVNSGAQLLSTDYPPRDGIGQNDYTAWLEGEFTVKLR